MHDEHKNIDDLFREGLGNYTEVPDAAVWADIERKLDESNPGGGATKGFGSGKIFLAIIAGIAIFFALKWALHDKHRQDKKDAIVITNEHNTSQTAFGSEPNNTTTNTASTNNTESKGNNKEDKDLTAPTSNNNEASIYAKNNANALTGNKAGAGTTKLSHRHRSHFFSGIAKAFSRKNNASARSAKLKLEDQQANDPKQPVEKPFNPTKENITALNGKTKIDLLNAQFPGKDFDTVDNGNTLARLLRRVRHSLVQSGIEGGVKAGVERGFNDYTATKYLLAPYLQYNISNKLSVLLQPALKYDVLNKTQIAPATAYYNLTNSTVTTGHIIHKGDSLTAAPDTITRRYFYKQTHDSILIGYKTAKKSYMEFEIPVLLQYKLTKDLSVYGGINFNFVKVVQVKEDRQVYSNITQYDTVNYAPIPVTATASTPPSPDSLFKSSVKSYSTYSANAIQNPASDPLKLGYMVGFNYRLKQRWMVDVLMQQMLSNSAYIPNDKVRSIYKQPYFRLMVGYSLFKSK